jgi:hypothetical protein
MAKIKFAPEGGVIKRETLGGAERGQSSAGNGLVIPRSNKAGRDDKLEVNYEGAWYTATLSAGRNGCTRVHYDDYDEPDEHWPAKKMKSLKPLHDYIRVLSEPMQDEHCRLVPVNTVVCALRKAKNDEDTDGWHDALVTSVSFTSQHFAPIGYFLCDCRLSFCRCLIER